MLSLERVSYRHAGAVKPALRDIDLSVGAGEVLGVVGPNEAGKSTLCLVGAGLAPRAIGGTLRGRVLVDGVDLASLATHELPAHVGIIFQDPSTQLSGVARTVYEEVAFGPSNLGVPRAELIERTESALGALHIDDLAARDPAHLSGGQQQLVAIASMLAMRPDHLILDEPTAQLDPGGTSLVADALARLAEASIPILIVEHKADLLARVATRVVVLVEGAIAFEGATGAVFAEERLETIGVSQPGAMRLRRLVIEAGLDPSALDRAVAS